MEREYMRVGAEVPGEAGSPWLAAEAPEWPSLSGERETDVLVIGAGISGALVASELAERGMQVTVCERRRVAGCTTGHSTAKITILHGTNWSSIVEHRTVDDALAEWAALNAAAPGAIGELVRARGIECRYRELDGYLCEQQGQDQALPRSWRTLRSLDVPAEDVGPVHGSPFGDVLAVRVPHQAQFDPAAFTDGLLRTLPEERVTVFERSTVRSLEPTDGGWIARLDDGSVRARLVVMTALAPVRDPAFLFTRLYPYAHYAIEVLPVEPPRLDGLWIEVTGGRLTARPTDRPEQEWTLSGVDARLADKADERTYFQRLSQAGESFFGASRITRHWSAEDFETPDFLPYVGAVGRNEGLFIVTGFAAWGMTKAFVAARLIADAITGDASTKGVLALLSPDRAPSGASALATFARENKYTARRFAVPSRAQRHATVAAGAAAPRVDAEVPRCTHMGCKPKVNTVELTIDCPCHGSRFTGDGAVLYGPARQDLPVGEKAKEPSEE